MCCLTVQNFRTPFAQCTAIHSVIHAQLAVLNVFAARQGVSGVCVRMLEPYFEAFGCPHESEVPGREALQHC